MIAVSRLRRHLSPLHIALLALWAILLFGGFILGKPEGDEQRRMPLWTRMGASITLTAAAWAWLAHARNAPTATRRMLLGLAAGMSLSTLGDFFMARLIIPGENAVLGGMASFGLGHVAYSLGILHFGAANRLTRRRLPALVGWWLFGLASWLGIVWLPAASRGVMHAAALPYALLLATTTGAATGLALNRRRFQALAGGAALFLFSDLILAGSLFSNWSFVGISDLIWLLYSPGQMLIVYAASAVLHGDGE
ncbi:MAG: lysoplasmalogenase [Anaerolineae bacterium]|nr:lysoplasmalogenase [Anaerolineae bacterium]NUQ04253.1 lysoplasmalogenase [Anaerolineae bacterium]